MPRDLNQLHTEATDQTLDAMPDLSSQSPTDQLHGEVRSAPMNVPERGPSEASWGTMDSGTGPEGVKVYSKQLGLSDLESCCVLEDSSFPPEQRCSREKFEYRLTVAPELCHGLFTTSSEEYDAHHLVDAETAKTSNLVETGGSRRQILIAHAIGTLSTNETVLDEDMALPPGWREKAQKDPRLGHKADGRVACLHSLAVLPSYQNNRVGSTLLKHYIDILRSSGNYDRLALIADETHVGYYENRGFKNLGKSKASFGGVEWNGECSLVYEIR